MSKVFEEIAKDASQLSRKQRLNLASLLLELDEGSEDEQLTAIWEQEILARIRAVDEGAVRSSTYEEVMQEAEDRLTS
ncbi:MAG: addiction module protein [Acidobacteriota bacterium]|nr:addiction module protein [Acidobacteriota bacterium]